MAGPLTEKERLALEAAARAGGLIRGRSGFYPGFTTFGPCHGSSTVRALVQRGLLARPHGSPARRVLTVAGLTWAASALPRTTPPTSAPAAAAPRAYID